MTGCESNVGCILRKNSESHHITSEDFVAVIDTSLWVTKSSSDPCMRMTDRHKLRRPQKMKMVWHRIGMNSNRYSPQREKLQLAQKERYQFG